MAIVKKPGNDCPTHGPDCNDAAKRIIVSFTNRQYPPGRLHSDKGIVPADAFSATFGRQLADISNLPDRVRPVVHRQVQNRRLSVQHRSPRWPERWYLETSLGNNGEEAKIRAHAITNLQEPISVLIRKRIP